MEIGFGHGNAPGVAVDSGAWCNRRQCQQVAAAAAADIGDVCRTGEHVCPVGADPLVTGLFEGGFGEKERVTVGELAGRMGAYPSKLVGSSGVFGCHYLAEL